MTRLIAFMSALAVLSAGCASHAAQATHAEPIRVMSFNIRNSASNDGVNSWPNRRELYLQTIRDFAPDLLGTQEVMADQHDELIAGLPGMQAIGVPRDDGKRKGEWSALFVRKDRFEVLDSGTFWLSETPDVVASKSWDAALTRICTWARLRDSASGKEMLCANTHFDHKGEKARENSAKLLVRKLPEIAQGAPIILIGDFNSKETTSAYHALTDERYFIDSYREIHPTVAPDECTFHAYTGRTAGSRIDFILHTPQFKTTAAQIDRTPAKDGVYPSDHYPVTGVIDWR